MPWYGTKEVLTLVVSHAAGQNKMMLDGLLTAKGVGLKVCPARLPPFCEQRGVLPTIATERSILVYT